MASEDQDIQQKISALAGQINRHKNQQTITATSSTSPYHRTFAKPYAPYPTRGRGYAGSRGKQFVTHRNRSLVLNHPQSVEVPTDPGVSGTAASTKPWVSRVDRHLQLINPAIYEKMSTDRSKAIENSHQRKLKQKNLRERIKLAKYLRLATTSQAAAPTPAFSQTATASPLVTIGGIRFRVSQDGNKLIRVNDVENLGIDTPKTGTLGGVSFQRSKNGNMYRWGIVKAQRSIGPVKKVDELCKIFSTTGSCSKGPLCRFRHDPNKLAVCKDFLLKSNCPNGDDCDLSHDLTPERTPTCMHFTRGYCTNASCHYVHAHVSASAPLCRAFGIYGFCDKGSSCPERHIMNECPDYSNTGVCHTKNCRLMHRDRATIMRKHAVQGDSNSSAHDLADLSSDEEGIDSDDVDSDDMEFFGFGDEDEKDTEILLQQDFVHF